MMRLRLLLLILILPACASTSATREATSSISTAEFPSTTAQDNPQVLFQFERSGGFAGINGRWTLFEDGNFISAAGDAYVFPPEDFIKLVELMSSLDPKELQISPQPFSSCADCFRYTLFVSQNGADLEFVWRDGDKTTPEALIQILEGVNRLIFKATQN